VIAAAAAETLQAIQTLLGMLQLQHQLGMQQTRQHGWMMPAPVCTRIQTSVAVHHRLKAAFVVLLLLPPMMTTMMTMMTRARLLLRQSARRPR